MQAYTAEESIWSNLRSVYKAHLSAVARKGLAEFTGQNKDWSYRVQKGFAGLSEAVPHYTGGYQCAQGYFKGSTSSCDTFGGSCKLAKH